MSNGESRFISRTAWDNDQLRRSQEIYTRNQQAEATAYVQNVSQAKLNDLRINFDQQAYHSMFGSNAQDNKIMVGLPSGTYSLSKAELNQEQARRNVIETERQNKLAAQRALQAQKEQVQTNSNNFSGSVDSQALDLNYFSQKYQELTSQGKTADATKLLNNAQSLGFSNEAVKENAQTGITAEQWYAFEDAHYQKQVQQPKEPEKTSEIVTGVIKGGKNILIDSTNQFLGTASLNAQKELLITSAIVRSSGDENKADEYINLANKPAISSIPNENYDNQYQQLGGNIVETAQIINDVRNPRVIVKNIDSSEKDLKSNNEKIQKINGRNPINSQYAGQTHPSGVKFNDEGFPDFEPYAKAKIRISGLTGNYPQDAARANKAARLTETPEGYVWHHVEDGKTMLLIPKSVHDAARHTGGAAVIRSQQ